MLMADETMNHSLTNVKSGYFNSFYFSTTEVVEEFSPKRIVGYINSTDRFNTYSGITSSFL